MLGDEKGAIEGLVVLMRDTTAIWASFEWFLHAEQGSHVVQLLNPRQHESASGAVEQAVSDDTPRVLARQAIEYGGSHNGVEQHAQTFFALTEQATGDNLPHFVKDRSGAFVLCAIGARRPAFAL